MKRILGLDLGTNSIGWALITQDFKNKRGVILGMGSRIIPMTQDKKDEFGKGNSISQTAERTGYRGVRRLRERHLLRRERLHRVLNILDFLPEHYKTQIDFENRLGQFKKDSEPKLPYHREFLFENSFQEMLLDFQKSQPELLEKGKKIPYDWTLYYLRKKGLSEKLLKEEIAWILLNFNQKRGYYQLRGEEIEEDKTKLVEFYSLKIVDITTDDDSRSSREKWYNLHLENGWIYRRKSKIPLDDWLNKTRDFIVTTQLEKDGSVKTDKEGNERRSFRSPKEDDWELRKKKTEQQIAQSGKQVGEYIYDALLKNPKQKVRGGLIRTIERKHYKRELEAILKKQIELQPNLFTEEKYIECVRELYRNNHNHRLNLSHQDFLHLFVEDIIFYQRPLRSQKSSITNCSLEYRFYKDKEGNKIKSYLKAIPKSNFLYQEFRVWQWLFNLRIYLRETDQDITNNFLSNEHDYIGLFEFLMSKKEVNHVDVLDFLIVEKAKKDKVDLSSKEIKNKIKKYRWNYVFDVAQEKEKDKSKKYPMNETGYEIQKRLFKVIDYEKNPLNEEDTYQLWHIIYSVKDKREYEKALRTFARKKGLNQESFVDNFKKFPPFPNDYGRFSSKAIKRLLSLMRMGKYWSWESVEEKTKDRIEKILTGEFDETIQNRVREKTIHLKSEKDFKGLPLWLAQYVIYDRHSESSDMEKWHSPKELQKYLIEFKQHSLRNPIVEQIVLETLRVVNDIWVQYGKGEENFFDEIHIELGREMKNTADARKRITSMVSENEATNQRIKLLLQELLIDSDIENVRPYSPIQGELLKIYEEGVLNSQTELPDDIEKISKSAQPTSKELQRYKLWLEQKYRSPYTGQTIPLSKLFTPAYEIEHVIPQSRYFDDSFSNKVICEAEVNRLKGNLLGFEFIKDHQGTIVDLGLGKSVKILNETTYENLVKQNYKTNRSKRKKLLLTEVPDQMIQRQMNDTRYISKFISSLLSNIVRDNERDEGVNSKNLIQVNGRITSELKNDWGLNNIWNNLILPRFKRMNVLTGSDVFTSWNEKHQVELPVVPLELAPGFSKKRIDHRHHAMDAVVIACTTSAHVNLLNNQYAKSKERFDLNRTLRNFVRKSYQDPITKEQIIKDVPADFILPWSTYTLDVKNQLEKTISSFKQNIRVINKATNQYESYKTQNGELRTGKDGLPKKGIVKQTKGDHWAIRKPLHKETVYAKVKLRKKKEVSLNQGLKVYEDLVDKKLKRKIKSLISHKYDYNLLKKFFKDRKNIWENRDYSRVEIYYWDEGQAASRKAIDTTFNEKKIKTQITDTGIQKILLNHLKQYENRLDDKGNVIPPHSLAFTPEGIDDMNKNIIQLNDGKFHQPIYKVRIYERMGKKFPVGYEGNKKDKYVVAEKGTNLFFAIYKKKNGERDFESIPLELVIERQKQGLSSVPESNENGEPLLFYLSPNDLVYVPTEEEVENDLSVELNNITKNKLDRLYKMVSSTKKECHFIPVNISSLIKQYDAKTKIGELGSLNKSELTIKGGVRIKNTCIKLKTDRLGNISISC